jgi:DnaJ family protein B protein 4
MDYPEGGRSPPEGAGGFSGFPSGGGGQVPRGVKVRFTHSNPEDIFRNFFGSSDPFADDDEGGGGGFPFMMGGQGGMHGM